jgi:hypothetical protein
LDVHLAGFLRLTLAFLACSNSTAACSWAFRDCSSSALVSEEANKSR